MKKIAIISLATLTFVAVIIFSARAFVLSRAHAPAENSPADCANLKQTPKIPRVLVLGDSITHGRVSANYVAMLARRYRGKYVFINAGVNSHLAHEALQRLGPALKACAPRAALVLIGTNDANSTLRSASEKAHMQRGLPRKPDAAWYEKNLRLILSNLKAAGVKRTAVYSLPLIGEDITSPENERVEQYNEIVRRTAGRARVPVLPLNRSMREYLKGRKIARRCAGKRYPVEEAVAAHYLFRRSWDDVSRSFGFHLTTDCLHFNTAGAKIIADLARPILDRASAP